MNVSNGGLIAQLRGDLYVCDLGGYGGTRVLSRYGALVGEVSAVMWFAASDGNGLYCSNQRDYDYLTYISAGGLLENWPDVRRDGDDVAYGPNQLFATAGRGLLTGVRRQKRACANLVMREGRVLFIDEEDGFIYEYDPKRDKCSPVLKERVSSFILVYKTIFFASESGLGSFGFHDGRKKKLADCFPVCLNYSNGYLLFADKRRDLALCRYDIGHGVLTATDGIKTQSIITAGDYIFASNLADGGSIVRAGLLAGEAIRFCGESADKLHIVGQHLYFLNQNDKNAWYRLPIAGGRPVPVFST